jgi:hypothetical protein
MKIRILDFMLFFVGGGKRNPRNSAKSGYGQNIVLRGVRFRRRSLYPSGAYCVPLFVPLSVLSRGTWYRSAGQTRLPPIRADQVRTVVGSCCDRMSDRPSVRWRATDLFWSSIVPSADEDLMLLVPVDGSSTSYSSYCTVRTGVYRRYGCVSSS